GEVCIDGTGGGKEREGHRTSYFDVSLQHRRRIDKDISTHFDCPLVMRATRQLCWPTTKPTTFRGHGIAWVGHVNIGRLAARRLWAQQPIAVEAIGSAITVEVVLCILRPC